MCGLEDGVGVSVDEAEDRLRQNRGRVADGGRVLSEAIASACARVAQSHRSLAQCRHGAGAQKPYSSLLRLFPRNAPVKLWFIPLSVPLSSFPSYNRFSFSTRATPSLSPAASAAAGRYITPPFSSSFATFSFAAPMALAALPVELLDAVLAPLNATPTALAAAARTCSALNPGATRLLYRHLSLSAYARNLSLIHLLAARPNLAALVRTFSIHLDDAEPAVLPTYTTLQRALHLMTNLSSLALYVDASTSWILSPPKGESGQKSGVATIPGPPFHPRLEHLTCNFPLDAHLASFLAQVPSLISLTLSSFVSDTDPESDSGHAPSPHKHVHIPSSHLPLLEAYTGPAHLLPTLVSRPLKTVLLSGDLSLDLLLPAGAPSQDAMMSCLRGKGRAADLPPSADSQLQVLSAMTSAPPADLLESLAIAFPNLVCLRLMTTRALWDMPDLVRNPCNPVSSREKELT